MKEKSKVENLEKEKIKQIRKYLIFHVCIIKIALRVVICFDEKA